MRSRSRNVHALPDRRRKDPWRAMAARVRRDASLPPSSKAMVDAMLEAHQDNPRFPVIRRGYGGRAEWTDQRGRVHRPRPGLAELTGTSRRTMIRDGHLLVERGYLGCRRGGGIRPEGKYCGRGGRGPASEREGRPEIVRAIGNGGRKPGGEGLANEYFPIVAGEPAPAEAPAEAPADVAAGRRRLQEAVDQLRQPRDRAP